MRGERAIIEVEDLSKWVDTSDGRLNILTGVTLAIKPGETLAVVGTSGSGKSTLLGILAGLDLPSKGKVYLGGSELTQLDEDGRAQLRARRVGFVFQSFQLLSNLTALENVMLPLELAGISDARQSARQALERVGLEHRLKHYPRQLSGGEQQRVALARAFVTTPDVLLADEPTGNLDSQTGERIIELLFEMNRERGATLVLVTHDEALASRCDRRIRLEAGRLQASADSSAVPESPVGPVR